MYFIMKNGNRIDPVAGGLQGPSVEDLFKDGCVSVIEIPMGLYVVCNNITFYQWNSIRNTLLDLYGDCVISYRGEVRKFVSYDDVMRCNTLEKLRKFLSL